MCVVCVELESPYIACSCDDACVACLELLDVVCLAPCGEALRDGVEGDDGVEGVGQLPVACEVLECE